MALDLAGQRIVLKHGGAAMVDPALAEAVLDDLVALRQAGATVVLVHGGGPEVSRWGERLGLVARFVDGLRVTDEATMRVAQLVQVGGISRDLLAGLGRKGIAGVGLSGQDGGGWLRARLRQHRLAATGEPVDLGRVGDVEQVDTRLPLALIAAGYLPVVAPVAVDEALAPLNVNADSVATAVAGALGAHRLLFLTDVAGVKGPDGAVVPTLLAAQAREWIASGVIAGGMIPKVEGCLAALAAGVGAVTIADGRQPHIVRAALTGAAGTTVLES